MPFESACIFKGDLAGLRNMTSRERRIPQPLAIKDQSLFIGLIDGFYLARRGWLLLFEFFQPVAQLVARDA